jgi:hypothetical protein
MAVPIFAARTMVLGWANTKMFRSLEHRDLMKFVDYQEELPVKDRVRRSRITDAGRAALLENYPKGIDAATV